MDGVRYGMRCDRIWDGIGWMGGDGVDGMGWIRWGGMDGMGWDV